MTISRKKLVISFMAFIIIVIILVLALFQNKNELSFDCVPTSIEAVEIGQIICKKLYPQFDYSQCNWEAIYHDKEKKWIVFCYKDEGVLGGGFPEIHVKKDNAQVVWVGLQR